MISASQDDSAVASERDARVERGGDDHRPLDLGGGVATCVGGVVLYRVRSGDVCVDVAGHLETTENPSERRLCMIELIMVLASLSAEPIT